MTRQLIRIVSRSKITGDVLQPNDYNRCFCRFANRVQSVHLLETGDDVAFEQKGDRLMLKGLPAKALNPIDTVIVIEVEGEPRAIDYAAGQARFTAGIPGDLAPTAAPAVADTPA